MLFSCHSMLILLFVQMLIFSPKWHDPRQNKLCVLEMNCYISLNCEPEHERSPPLLPLLAQPTTWPQPLVHSYYRIIHMNVRFSYLISIQFEVAFFAGLWEYLESDKAWQNGWLRHFYFQGFKQAAWFVTLLNENPQFNMYSLFVWIKTNAYWLTGVNKLVSINWL